MIRLLLSVLIFVGLSAFSPSERIILFQGSTSSGVSEVQVLGTQIGVGLSDTGTAGASNLLNQTQQTFTGAEWQTSSTVGGVTTFGTQTISDAGVTDPLSGSTASTFTEAAATTTHAFFAGYTPAAGSTQYTFSISLKQGLRTRAAVQVNDVTGSNGVYMVCDLAGVQIGVADAAFGSGWTAGTTPAVTSQSNGFVRCGVTFTTPSTNAGFQVGVGGDSNSGTQALHNSYAGNASSPAMTMWGANLNTGASIVAYGRNTNNGLAAASSLNTDTYTQTNFWGTETANAWVGVDAGTAVQWTRYRFAPQPGSRSLYGVPALDYETLMQGATVQTNLSDSTFTSGNTTVDTIPATPFYPRFHLNERTLSGAASRYIRINPVSSAAFGGIGQLEFFAKAGSTYNARPVAPVISPWGGMVESNPVAVTMTSLTKQASIYYTTDGSTPTTSSTLYSGAVAFSPSSSSTIKALACWSALTTPCSAVVSAIFHNYDFAPRDDWYDNRGVLIEAHQGGVTWDAATNLYYWVGGNMNQQSPAWDSTFPTVGIPRKDVGPILYSSPTGRAPWTYIGNILPMPSGTNSAGKPWISLVREHILPASACGGTYVLWGHVTAFDSGANDRAAVATAPSITGPWTWGTINLNPDSVGFKDNSLFYDGTGAYVVYTIGTQNGIQISKLASNCLTTTSTVALTATQREAPVLMNGPSGGYFLITSISNTYNSAAAMTVDYVYTANSTPMSGWAALPGSAAFAVDPIGGNYNMQPSFALIPQGHTQYFIGGDFWTSTIASPLYNSRQVWLPVTFPTSSTMQIGIPATWNISGLN